MIHCVLQPCRIGIPLTLPHPHEVFMALLVVNSLTSDFVLTVNKSPSVPGVSVYILCFSS